MLNRQQLMKGRVQVETEPSSNIIRMFVSSTFTDMANERNVLYNNAYPELRSFCQNLGMEFQIIDMRWGIRDIAVVDHSTTSLCLLEVQACKKVSAGPYFVVFLGNRYGYQPLPSAISDTEFQILQRIAEEQNLDDEGLLDQWYSHAAEMLSQNFEFDSFVFEEFAKERDYERQEWNRISDKLTDVLRVAANTASKRHLWRKDSHLKYSKSVTHMEVEEALLGGREHRVLAYNREIPDLRKHMGDRNVGKYIDMIEEGRIDKPRQKMLESLKKNIRQSAEGNKVYNYEVPWRYIENADSTPNADDVYLLSLCEKFVSDIKKNISYSRDKRENSPTEENTDDPLLNEVLHHARLEFSKTADFCGRQTFIGDVISLIRDHQNHQPIVLSGRSGCGKTALMAKLVETMRSSSPTSTTLIYRFLGTSPECSNIHKVLKSLILQISSAYHQDPPQSHLMQNFSDVSDLFGKMLHKISKILSNGEEGTLCIFLDSIDQLSEDDGAHRMTWIPKKTPPKIKLVISSLPEPDYKIVPVMRKHIAESNFFCVEGLTVETAQEISDKYLGFSGRKLTSNQTEKILQAFFKSPYPLFLKLMLEEAKSWRSYYDVEALVLPDCARSAIDRFYERLEVEHGKVIFSRVMGFIVAARDGVTENELQDLLSLDNEVLYEAYQYWSPPTDGSARFPSFTWTRLSHDLGNYLVRRQAADHTVLALHHRQFIEVARERYLQPSDALKIYGLLSEYFLGVFSNGTAKKLKLNMWDDERMVDRRVASQPLKFSKAVYNVRKLRELPYCLLKGEKIDTLKDVVLADPHWILVKSKAFSLKEVIEDYNLYLNDIQDVEIRLIKDSIMLAKPTLEFTGGVRNHLYVELFCRMEYFVSKFPKYLGSLVRKCFDLLKEDLGEIILPLNGCFQSPGGPLRTTVTGFRKPVTCLKFANTGEVFAAASEDGKIIIWDAENDEVLQKIEAHSDSITAIDIVGSNHGYKVASCSVDNTVKIFDVDNGTQCFNQVDTQLYNSSFTKVILQQERIYCATDKKVISWKVSDSHVEIEKEFGDKIRCLSILSNEQNEFVLLGLESGKFHCVNMATGEEKVGTNLSSAPIMDIMKISEINCLVLWESGDLALINALTLEELDAETNSGRTVVDWCKSENGFDLALKNEIISYSTGEDKLKKSSCHTLHDQKIRKIRHAGRDKIAVAYENKKTVIWNMTTPDNPVKEDMWEGMGASIDHLVIGKDVGVTASNQVFYLKIWDLNDKDQVQIADSLPLTSRNSVIGENGETLAYIENGGLVIQSMKEEAQKEKVKLFSLGIDENTLNTLRFAQTGILALKNDGSLLKVSCCAEENGTNILFADVTGNDHSKHDRHLLLAVRSDGRRAIVLTVSNGRHDLHVLDTENTKLLSTVSVAMNDKSGVISSLHYEDVTPCSVLFGTTNGYLHRLKFDEESGKILAHKIASSKHSNEITCLALSHNATMLFSGSFGRTRRIWNLMNEIPVLKHSLHFMSLLDAGVTCAQFTSDDRYVLSGSKERSLTVWDTKNGALIWSQYVYAPVLDLVVTEGNELIYTTELGYVGKAKFRPPSAQSNSGQKMHTSRTCILM